MMYFDGKKFKYSSIDGQTPVEYHFDENGVFHICDPTAEITHYKPKELERPVIEKKTKELYVPATRLFIHQKHKKKLDSILSPFPSE